MKELVFESEPHVRGDGFIDGPCKLPETLQWPVGPNASPLFHLLSVPLGWLVPDVVEESTQDRWVSVFISYDKTGYSHYGMMSSDDIDNSEAAVILHDMSGPERSMHNNQGSKSKNVKLVPATDGDDNVASYINSKPSWVQDPIAIDGLRWALSIYGPDIDICLGENRGILSDGVGYVFLKSDFCSEAFGPVGKFFLQL